MENTYDAYVHMFFADHYSNAWFETWNYKWYTGFTMTSYPPLVHQLIAILSKVIGLKAGFLVCGLAMVALFIRGIYHFSKIWVNDLSASYACILAVLSSSFIEALHLFGQLPSLMGIALLLNACPEIYRWIRDNNRFRFYTGISILATVTAAHHVSTIFGMVFFVLPVMGVAVLDICILDKGGVENVRFMHFVKKIWSLLPKAVLLGVSVIAITALIIFPYWYWSKTDPISQVSIPHGSRANFLEDLNLGLVFFVIPWGMMLFFLPGIFYRVFKKRNIFLGLSFALALLLGTGGTTPIPKLLLGETAFNILTLDRFTIWATILALPFFGDLVFNLVEGNFGDYIINVFGRLSHKIVVFCLILGLLISSALIINIGSFRPLQPDSIDPDPIVNFLSVDNHDDWRYLTLGFGDQVAWIATQTNALSVDGNYHSARRLPELTTRAVERLENSKYLGMEGLGALQQFLGVPEKYHLKYIFNNDKFYEPLLFFYGWTKLIRLENNIDVWERKDVLPLPSILPKKEIPKIQKYMWGILPIACLIICLLVNFVARRESWKSDTLPRYHNKSKLKYWTYGLWLIIVSAFMLLFLIRFLFNSNPHKNPQNLLEAYYNHIDFKEFDDAYKLYDPNQDYSKEQFLLELSLEDGLLASYAKLDEIEIEPNFISSDTYQEYQVTSHWITGVKKYSNQHNYKLIKKNKQWFIEKSEYEKKLPPDQFLRIAEVDFYNQGRRKATTNTSIREDILDRPEVITTHAQLVKRNENYHIVGQLINVDNDPAFISIDVSLYDVNDEEIIQYSTSDIIIHNLLPKESTPFRIDFDDILWQMNKTDFPEDFDSNQKTEMHWPRKPVKFVLNLRSMVTDQRLYKYYGLEYSASAKSITGDIINYGNQEMAIPQILTAQYENGITKWVDVNYLPKGIRPQRSKSFNIELEDLKKIDVIYSGTSIDLLSNSANQTQLRRVLPNSFLDKTNEDHKVFINALVNFKN